MTKKLLKQFRADTGYTSYIGSTGEVRKDYKHRKGYTFESIDKMMIDFAKWLNKPEAMLSKIINKRLNK